MCGLRDCDDERQNNQQEPASKLAPSPRPTGAPPSWLPRRLSLQASARDLSKTCSTLHGMQRTVKGRS